MPQGLSSAAGVYTHMWRGETARAQARQRPRARAALASCSPMHAPRRRLRTGDHEVGRRADDSVCTARQCGVTEDAHELGVRVCVWGGG